MPSESWTTACAQGAQASNGARAGGTGAAPSARATPVTRSASPGARCRATAARRRSARSIEGATGAAAAATGAIKSRAKRAERRNRGCRAMAPPGTVPPSLREERVRRSFFLGQPRLRYNLSSIDFYLRRGAPKPTRAWVLAVLLFPPPAAAVTGYRVADIDPSVVGVGSQPAGFASLGRGAIFFTEAGELWSSGGVFRPVRLADERFIPEALAVGERLAYLLAGASATPRLWVTDGVVADTGPVTGPLRFDGLARRHPVLVMPGTDRLFFAAGDEAHGEELWTSDGTSAGTFEVADLAAGPEGSAPHELTRFRDRVFFTADDGRGASLFSSDGAAEGTRLVSDPDPDRRQAEGPRFLTAVGARLYFFVRTSDGWSLW